MSVAFLVTTLVVVVTPGTGVVLTLAAGLSGGARAAVAAAAGCTLGIVPHVLATVTGAAAVLHTSAVAYETLRYLGVAYLLWAAWSALRDTGPIAVADAAPRTARGIVTGAVLANLLNPKLTIFFFAFLPQFVAPGEPCALARMVELSAVFMALTFAVFTAYGCAAAAVRRHVLARPRVVRRLRLTFAATFLALGATLALGDR